MSPLRSPDPLVGARISGLGSARLTHLVAGADLAEPFGKSAEWLGGRTGIATVGRLGSGETALDLAETAGLKALAEAGTTVGEVGSLVVASCSTSRGPNFRFSELVAERLGIRAPCADLNAACSGFVYALSSATATVRTGGASTALVVAVEQMSTLIDPTDLGTSILFGEGAGAAVVTACRLEDNAISAPTWTSDGALSGLLEVPDGESTLRMNGQAVFRRAIESVPPVIATALSRAGVAPSDIDVFVPHQAIQRIIDVIAVKAGLEHCIIADDIKHAGNTSAASIPLALTRLRENGSV
jgi:3-oxoacyl-[acyl-carrier-protein] synthase-3